MEVQQRDQHISNLQYELQAQQQELNQLRESFSKIKVKAVNVYHQC